MFGKKHSEETKRKISMSNMGHPCWTKGKKQSEETKQKISSALRGRKFPSNKKGMNHHLWQGGKTGIQQQIRNSAEYREWRRSVFERDGFTCVLCGLKKSGNLNADHIKPFALFPESRFVVENGRTLCVSCHKKTKTYGVQLPVHKNTLEESRS